MLLEPYLEEPPCIMTCFLCIEIEMNVKHVKEYSCKTNINIMHIVRITYDFLIGVFGY